MDSGMITPRQKLRKVHVSNSRERIAKTDLLTLVHATSSVSPPASSSAPALSGTPLVGSTDANRLTWSIMINQLVGGSRDVCGCVFYLLVAVFSFLPV
jgi:hypothetical protein